MACPTEYDREALVMRRPWPTGGFCTVGGRGGELDCHVFVTDRSLIIITYSVIRQDLPSPETVISNRIMVVT